MPCWRGLRIGCRCISGLVSGKSFSLRGICGFEGPTGFMGRIASLSILPGCGRSSRRP